MPTLAPNQQPSALDLAIGLATYLKLPIAIRLGLKSFLEAGDFLFSVEAADVMTGSLWKATSCCFERDGVIVIQFWDEVEIGEADSDLVEQTAVALQDFLLVPKLMGKRILVQALEWEEEGLTD